MNKHESSEKPFSCSECNKEFDDSESRDEHEAQHDKNEQFKCMKCGLEFEDVKRADRLYKTQNNLCSYKIKKRSGKWMGKT